MIIKAEIARTKICPFIIGYSTKLDVDCIETEHTNSNCITYNCMSWQNVEWQEDNGKKGIYKIGDSYVKTNCKTEYGYCIRLKG